MTPQQDLRANDTPHAGDTPLLSVGSLKTHFFTEDGIVRAVDGVDFDVLRGETFALVGESGCGKTVTACSILRIVVPPGRIVGGEITFKGYSLLELSEKEMLDLRGRQISMIFQHPGVSLNPVFTVWSQLAEVLQVHRGLSRKDARHQAIDLLHVVGMADEVADAGQYPHELSSGQAQRVMIAMALATNPELLIADEPTSALDPTIQAQILALLEEMQSKVGSSVLLITHDLGLVAQIADRVAVMYAGTIVESSIVRALFEHPMHPYTQGLMAAIPLPGRGRAKLSPLPGAGPDPMRLPAGCRFAARCAARTKFGLAVCEQVEPDLIPGEASHAVRCWLYQDSALHRAPLSGHLPSPTRSD